MKTALKILCFGTIFLLALAVLNAQQTGEIRGRITEEKGEILPGVAITAKSLSLQGIRTSLSDKDGFFRLPLLPVGKYELTFELPGFEKTTMTGLAVNLGFTSTYSIVLKPAAISEEVIVSG